MLQFFLPCLTEPKCRNLLLLTELRGCFPNVWYLSPSSWFILIWAAATTTLSAGQVDRCCAGALQQNILPFCVNLLSFPSQTYKLGNYKPRLSEEIIPWFPYFLFKPTQLQSKDAKIKIKKKKILTYSTHFDTTEASVVLLVSSRACGGQSGADLYE